MDDGERVQFRQGDARLDEELGGPGDVGQLPLPLPGAGDGLRVALHPVLEWVLMYLGFLVHLIRVSPLKRVKNCNLELKLVSSVTFLHRVESDDGLVVGVEAALDGGDDRGGGDGRHPAAENTLANLLRAPPECGR